MIQTEGVMLFVSKGQQHSKAGGRGVESNSTVPPCWWTIGLCDGQPQAGAFGAAGDQRIKNMVLQFCRKCLGRCR